VRAGSLNQAWGTLKESQPKIYNVTVENAGKPGLPPPVVAAASLPAAELAGSPAHKTKVASAVNPQDDPVLREAEQIMVDYVDIEHLPLTVAVAAH
jgi:hypothetical protein